ncbi:MAG: hypothetical protein P4L80_15825 [Xanthobacteraceae bacterium]|nr:hypothetical protein [Xanthobacteraceae bacterium]
MKMRKLVAVLATATVAFWTPSVVPVKAQLVRCGAQFDYLQCQTVDTAYAANYIPCPTGHGGSPWPAVTVIVGVVGVMVNAAWIWNTQCRELTSQEAMTSTFLPFIGMVFDAQASKCHR